MLFCCSVILCGGSASLPRRERVQWTSTSGYDIPSPGRVSNKMSPLHGTCSSTPYMYALIIT